MLHGAPALDPAPLPRRGARRARRRLAARAHPRAGAGRWRVAGGALAAVARSSPCCPCRGCKADLADPPGSAWRLDGRLEIDGEVIDPPGSWYWLTVGRPPIVAEVAWSWLTDDPAPASMLGGRRAQRPNVVEPAAAAVGLRRAGRPIELGLLVEASDPQLDGLPAPRRAGRAQRDAAVDPRGLGRT